MAEVIKINENTWRIEDEYVRFFLLEGSDKAALIDSGMNCPNAMEIAKGITDKPVVLINTHGDRDHTSGTGAFDEIYIHPSDYSGCGLVDTYSETKLVEINDGDVIDLGNRPLKIIHIPGHTKGSVAILDERARTLIAGDSVQKGHIYMFGNHRIPSEYEASLDKLISIKSEYDTIYASHDEYLLPAGYVELVKEAWKKVSDGSVPAEDMDLYGMKVKSYTTEVCGFYM